MACRAREETFVQKLAFWTLDLSQWKERAYDKRRTCCSLEYRGSKESQMCRLYLGSILIADRIHVSHTKQKRKDLGCLFLRKFASYLNFY
jgi:hypothetical protein